MGASQVETRDMARHGSTKMTDIYSRSRSPRHHELAESVYSKLTGADQQKKWRKSGERKIAVGEPEAEMPVSDNELVTYGHSEMVAGGGFEPVTGQDSGCHMPDAGGTQNAVRGPDSGQYGTSDKSNIAAFKTEGDASLQHPGRGKWRKSGEKDPLLAKLAAVIDDLQEHERKMIEAIVEAHNA